MYSSNRFTSNLNNELWGYYQSPAGCHDSAAAFFDTSGSGWVSFNGHPEPIGYGIWSDQGVGYTFTPIIDSIGITYQFIDLGILGYPEIPAGTIFGVVLKNKAPLGTSRVGLRGTSVGTGGQHQNSLFKFYCEAYFPGPISGPIPGWWSRDVILGFAAVVEHCSVPPPDIYFTILTGGTDLGPYSIDANIIEHSCFPPWYVEIDSAKIQWSTDEGINWNDVPMTDMGSNNWNGEIPAQPGNIKVTYRIVATDVNGFTFYSNIVSFYTFEPSGASTLVIFNGFADPTGYPQDFYFGPNTEFDHDTWVSGRIPNLNLLNNYTNIFEIWYEANGAYNDSLITLWLTGASNRNYFLAGQEWLGAKNNFTDSAYLPGTFEYEILGITYSWNDVSYDGFGSQNIPSLVIPQVGTRFGQPLQNLFNSLNPPADSMMYDPMFVTGNNNWIDAYYFVPDVEIDMMVETRGIQGVTNVDTLPTMSHRILPAGNKIVFAAYDPISLTTAVNDSFPYYYWVGYDTSNSAYQALMWFGAVTEVKEPINNTPLKFSLEQNYPNPFNPSTKIKFTIPSNVKSEMSNVTLKVYDVLGNEVATLVNEELPVGEYEVEFNSHSGEGRNLPCGVYFYELTVGGPEKISGLRIVQTKKMIYLK